MAVRAALDAEDVAEAMEEAVAGGKPELVHALHLLHTTCMGDSIFPRHVFIEETEAFSQELTELFESDVYQDELRPLPCVVAGATGIVSRL